MDSSPGKTYFSQSFGLKKLLRQFLFYFKGQGLKSKVALESDGTTKDIKQGKNLKSKVALKSERGQVAIFMVFVFQVLFILFGMTINVGMTVYDKINFQNSLDLAAYYGAKKQAEVLNAMAHINYQMRQNWKLLSWRYRILGTLTQDDGWPGPLDRPPNPNIEAWCPQNNKNNGRGNIGIAPGSPNKPPCRGNADNPYYFVCVSNSVWKRGVKPSPAQSICEKANTTIPAVEDSALAESSNGLNFDFARLANRAIRNLQQSLDSSCPLERALNYLTAQLFLTHARLDQKDRKTLLRRLYHKTLEQGNDLDGKPIKEGVAKVFYHNLTISNQKNVQSQGGSDQVLQYHNSYSIRPTPFESVFGWINTAPVLHYLYIGPDNAIGQQCTQFTIYPHMNYGQNGPPNTANLNSFFNDLTGGNSNSWASIITPVRGQMESLFLINNRSQVVEQNNNPLATMTLGFYKKPRTELYYGLFAKMNYEKHNQLFGLWGDVKFKASSFAKPFGGRFGPNPADPRSHFDDRIYYRVNSGGGAGIAK